MNFVISFIITYYISYALFGLILALGETNHDEDESTTDHES